MMLNGSKYDKEYSFQYQRNRLYGYGSVAYLGPRKVGATNFQKVKNTPPYFLIEFRPLLNYFHDFYHVFLYFLIHFFLINSHAKGEGAMAP